MELAQILGRNFMFQGLPTSVLNTFAACADIQALRGGETVVRQFENKDDLIVVLEGELVARNFRGDTMARFSAGGVVGEMALVDGSPRSATIVSSGPAKVAIIPSSCIHGMIDVEPEFGNTIYRNIAVLLARRLRSMNEQMGQAVALR